MKLLKGTDKNELIAQWAVDGIRRLLPFVDSIMQNQNNFTAALCRRRYYEWVIHNVFEVRQFPSISEMLAMPPVVYDSKHKKWRHIHFTQSTEEWVNIAGFAKRNIVPHECSHTFRYFVRRSQRYCAAIDQLYHALLEPNRFGRSECDVNALDLDHRFC